MLPAIAYTLACFVVAAIMTCGWVLTRPIHVRDEMRSWRVLLALFVLCFLGPYLYNETLTRIHGQELEHAIKAAYSDVPVQGHMIYYKVTSFKGDEAHVLVVSEEKEDWGGTDHPQIGLKLERKGKGWKTTSYTVLNSERLNKEAYVFPVYW